MVYFCIVCLLRALWASLFHGFSLATGNLFVPLRPPFLGQLRMRQGWILDKKASNGTGESVYTNVNFGTVPRLPVPRLPPGGTFSAPQTFWALVPHFIWEGYV